MSCEFMIRSMTRSELDFAIELAANEGWNPGLDDADAFFAADPDGFLVGILDNRPIGCISAISYPGCFGFIGFYIVLPDFRSRGFGSRLWARAMRRLDGHNIGLDGVFDQQDNYRKSGFKLAYRNVRLERRGNVPSGADTSSVRALDTRDVEAVVAYDRRCFPAERVAFLEHWIRNPRSTALGYVTDRGLEGYGVIRPCREGWKVGPLFADDRDRAHALYSALAAVAEQDDPVYLDVPEVNADGMALAEDLGMRPVFGTARMYTGPFPEIDLDRVFGVTSFELG